MDIDLEFEDHFEESQKSIEGLFPHDSFRTNQKEALLEIKDHFDDGKEVVIFEGPTGTGKSPMNIALALYHEKSFYTAPQIKLVNQVANDYGSPTLAIDGGKSDIMSLLGRKNYICKRSKKPSDKCPFYEDIDHSCTYDNKCTYGVQKKAAQHAKVAVLTFAMLIINSYLSGDASFDKRNLLIVDECHSLEGQVASMFAGYSLSPYSFPSNIRINLWNKIQPKLPKKNVPIEEYLPLLRQVKAECRQERAFASNESTRNKLDNFTRKIDYMLEEIAEDRTWIVNKGKVKFGNGYIERPEFKPIRVDSFLNRRVWYQAKKILLTSATIPFRDDPQKWLTRLGLGKRDHAFVSVPMTFPIRNRPIITSTMGGKMTSKQERFSLKENLKTVVRILRRHSSEQGVIHTQSYDRAKKLARWFRKYSVFLHDKNELDEDVITAWINSGEKVLLSPAVKEGVDLKHELCRYQILLKVPYPSMGDKRVQYLVNVQNQWKWYYSEAIRDVVQMYGRGVRSETDYAKFYVVDGSFSDLINRKGFPDWFLEAITNTEVL